MLQKFGMCYLKNVANDDLISEVKNWYFKIITGGI